MFPNARSFDAENLKRAEQHLAALRLWQESSIAQFKRQVEHGQVVTLNGANHYVFLTNADEVIELIDRFFDGQSCDKRLSPANLTEASERNSRQSGAHRQILGDRPGLIPVLPPYANIRPVYHP